jgi:hypothetical protein
MYILECVVVREGIANETGDWIEVELNSNDVSQVAAVAPVAISKSQIFWSSD